MNLKFSIKFILFIVTLCSNLLASQNEEYQLIDNSYKSFLKENSESKKEWYNKPCEYIDYLQKQFLKSENEEDGKEYAKLLKLSLQDGLYFKYQKQTVSKDQLNQLSGLFQKAKVISNIGSVSWKNFVDRDDDSIYVKTFSKHVELISRNHFVAFSWRGVNDHNYMIDNFWITLQKNIENDEEKKSIEKIRYLPLYQRDIFPQYFLDRAIGFPKNQNYRLLELFKKPLEDEHITEMLENFEDINSTSPYFFYNPDVQKKFPSKNNNKHDAQQITDNCLKSYLINQQHIKIYSLDDIKDLDSKKLQKASSLELDLFKEESIDDLKTIFDILKKYNFYEIKLFITFCHTDFADLINQFLNNFKNLYSLRLDLNNRTEKSIKIQSPKDLKKLRTLQIGSNGFFDFSNIFKKLSESKYLDTILLFNHQIHNTQPTNPESFQKIYGDISKAVSLKTFHIYDQNLIKNEEDVDYLGVLLDSLVNLEDLELSLKIGNTNPEPYHQLFNNIVKNKNLTDLALRFDFFDKTIGIQSFPLPTNEEFIKDCIGFLEIFNEIERLSLGFYFEKSNKNIKSVTDILRKLSNLDCIDLNFTYSSKNSQIDPETFNGLTESISAIKNLQRLNLALVTANQQENQDISRIITNLRSLKHISLHTQNKNDKDYLNILKAIGTNKQLQYLNLSFAQNVLDNNFYETLLQNLQNSQKLEYLSLYLPFIRNQNQQTIIEVNEFIKNKQYLYLKLLVAKLNNLQSINVCFSAPPATMEESKKYDELVKFANQDLRNVISQKKKAFYQLLPIRNTLYKMGLRGDIAFDILRLLHLKQEKKDKDTTITNVESPNNLL